MTAMSHRSRHSRIAAGLFLLSAAAGATALTAGSAAAASASPASAVHAAGQVSNPSAAPDNTVWD